MRCHVCSRTSTLRLHFFCSTCARNELYKLRIENARTILDKESLGKSIEDAMAPMILKQDSTTKAEVTTTSNEQQSSHWWIVHITTNEQARSSARRSTLESHIEALRSDIRAKQLELSQRKAVLLRRRSDAETARYQLSEREAALLVGIQNNTRRTDHLWHSLHNKTAEARIFLCREAAVLYGLRQGIKKRDGRIKETHTIGGVPIIDLRDMNGATPAQLSTSLSYIAHLLVLISHYLSLRLPAEVTLPHKDHPATTIYGLSGSYLPRHKSSTSFESQQSHSSPTYLRQAERHRHSPRPRPLSIDKSLPKLHKEDRMLYDLFLEGVTLLAWDVTWLCRTQGLHVTLDSWERICDIGKNMWQLLVAPLVHASTLTRAFAGYDIQSKLKVKKDSPRTSIQRTKSFPILGHYSHGTVHSFLAAAEGTEFVRTWKIPPPAKVFDQLKANLQGEMASAEWELLEKKEWDDEFQVPSEADMRSNQVMTPSEHTSTTLTTRTDPPESNDISRGITNEPINVNRLKGTSGWTKLRNR